jgi:hypothetical protein
LRYINDAAIDSVPNDVAQMSRTDQGDLVQSNRRRPAAQRVIRKKSMSMNGERFSGHLTGPEDAAHEEVNVSPEHPRALAMIVWR